MTAAMGDLSWRSWRCNAAAAGVVLALVFTAASTYVVARPGRRDVSYAATSGTLATIAVLAGMSLVAAGITEVVQRERYGWTGRLLIVLAVTWFAASWIGWQRGPNLLRSLAMVIAPCGVAVLAHLAVLDPSGTLERRSRRRAVAAVYAVTLALSVATALVREPFRDRYCWDDCETSSFLVHRSPTLARSAVTASMWWALGLGAAVVFVCATRVVRATAPGRRQITAVAVPVAGAATAIAVHAAWRLADPAERPTQSVWITLYVITAVAMAGVAAGQAWRILDNGRRRRSVRELTAELAHTSHGATLRDVLAHSLGDPGLQVAYCLDSGEGYVTADGERCEATPTSRRTAVPIERGGRQLAIVLVDSLVAASHDLHTEIGSAARLAIDNERLRAHTLRQIVELRASRRRIVDTAERTRRQLERDLHDGVQQRLLALGYQVELARDEAVADDDEELQTVLDRAALLVTTSVTELRELANGLFPVILHEAGLRAALATFADDALIRLDLDGLPPDRLPEATEAATYLTITRLVADAERRSATHLSARVCRHGSNLEVDLHDDGRPSDRASLIGLGDRLAAIGGTLRLDAGRTLAVIPCA